MSGTATLLAETEETQINGAKTNAGRNCCKQCTGKKWAMNQTNPCQIWAWTTISHVPKPCSFCKPLFLICTANTTHFGEKGRLQETDAPAPPVCCPHAVGALHGHSLPAPAPFCRTTWVSARADGSIVFYTAFQVRSHRIVMEDSHWNGGITLWLRECGVGWCSEAELFWRAKMPGKNS